MTDSELQVLLSIERKVGELDVKITKVDGKTDVQTEKLIAIETQTTKTNGRVNNLEGKVRVLEDDKVYRKGRSALIGAITGVAASLVLPLLVDLFKTILHKI